MKSTLNHITILLLVVVAMAMPQKSSGADATTTAKALWAEGIEAYEGKNYASAVESFSQIVNLGEANEDVYYNLANAYFKLGQHATTTRPFGSGELGRAILNYHRALRLNPAMADARYNLELAVDHTNDTESVPKSFIAVLWHSLRDSATSNGWTIASLVMLGAMLILVMFYLLNTHIVLRKVCFSVALTLLVGVTTTLLLAISSRNAVLNDNRAVVLCNDTTPVHASPDNASKIIRQPSQGVTIYVERTHGDWAEIRFADGEKGWIQNSRIELI